MPCVHAIGANDGLCLSARHVLDGHLFDAHQFVGVVAVEPINQPVRHAIKVGVDGIKFVPLLHHLDHVIDVLLIDHYTALGAAIDTNVIQFYFSHLHLQLKTQRWVS